MDIFQHFFGFFFSAGIRLKVEAGVGERCWTLNASNFTVADSVGWFSLAGGVFSFVRSAIQGSDPHDHDQCFTRALHSALDRNVFQREGYSFT